MLETGPRTNAKSEPNNAPSEPTNETIEPMCVTSEGTPEMTAQTPAKLDTLTVTTRPR